MSTSINSKHKVMIVDDSAVVRGAMDKILTQDKDIEVVYKAFSGEDALTNVPKTKPEVIVLDIEMKGLDGISAIDKLLALDKNLKIVMFTSMNSISKDVRNNIFQLGAVDFFEKPSSFFDSDKADQFIRKIIRKVKDYGALYKDEVSGGSPNIKINKEEFPRVIRKSSIIPKVIAIGSSTGGPHALEVVVKSIREKVNVPIFITQHMPRNFTKLLADNLGQVTNSPAVEAQEGMVVQNNTIYVAPGDFHMLIQKNEDGQCVIELDDGPDVNFCRPAVDPMFRSIVKAYSGAVLGIILTGMGQDGLNGSIDLVKSGGNLIAQDEASSVVWGMPAAVAKANICDAILPLDEIGKHVTQKIYRVS